MHFIMIKCIIQIPLFLCNKKRKNIEYYVKILRYLYGLYRGVLFKAVK